MLACECLNVIIEAETEGQKVSPAELQLTEDELRDPFFRQDIEQLGKLIKINKVHSGLIHTRIVGPWIVNCCLNCGVNSHALHQQRGAALVLVSPRLLKKQKIEALRKTDAYSTIYKIVINPHEHEDRPSDDLPRELETTVSNLKQIASDILAREAAAAEERIRIFTERETIALDLLKERAQNEHKTLVKKLINTTTNLKPTKNVPTERSALNSPKAKAQKLPDNFPSGNASSQPISIKARAPLSGNAVRGRKLGKKRSVEKRIRHTSSVDAEAMFQFDTTDEEEATFQSEIDESDNDDAAKEDAIGSFKEKNPFNIAKSLPMDIPVFMSSFQNHLQDDADDSLPSNEDVLDIAASIKALAKSVHGDTVFGDLPRPRFSSQI